MHLICSLAAALAWFLPLKARRCVSFIHFFVALSYDNEFSSYLAV
jgi:hypothetical protein